MFSELSSRKEGGEIGGRGGAADDDDVEGGKGIDDKSYGGSNGLGSVAENDEIGESPMMIRLKPMNECIV